MSGPQAELTVLLVDDEEGFVQTLARRLARRGMTVRTALSGPLALEELKRGPVAVVVLDLKMAGMDGLEILRTLRVLLPKIRAVMLTGHGSNQIARQCLEEGAFAYLNKPCEFSNLVAHIQRAAAGKG